MIRHLVLCCLILIASSCARYAVPISGIEIQPRVLLGEARNFTIYPKGSYIISINNQSWIASGALKIAFHSKGICVNNKILLVDYVDVQGTKVFQWNKNDFRGSFRVHRSKTGLSLINNVYLEEYLLSVVPSETYSSWSMNTLKAQAVASRTFALYEIKRRRNNASNIFDLYADTKSQVYRGIKSENKKTTQAVLATSGQVLTHQGQLIKSYFSASSGGVSADGSEIGDVRPYLKSTRSHRSQNKLAQDWKINIPINLLQKALNMKNINSISVHSRTESGRIAKLAVKDSRGKMILVPGDHFRTKIGATKMKSTLAGLKSCSDKLVIYGRGYGHGVGMGQWEAEELAKKGASYQKILTHFYRETHITKLY
ncbi:MAG: SpoIID/LytB domain-containing protein [Brevinemataceae bacterium]